MNRLKTLYKLYIVFLASFFFINAADAANNVSVTATIGTGGPYATLYAAFSAINAGTFKGVINININGNTTETSSPVLNYSGDGSASYTSVTIKPTVVCSIRGDIGGAFIKLYGASNVTIDGSMTPGGTTQDLTITNTTNLTTFTTAVIQVDGTSGHGATGDTIRNCIISGYSSTTTFAGIISCGDGISTYSPQAAANTGLTIHNNAISNVRWGIGEVGPSTSPYNSNVSITGNQLSTLGLLGILIAWENNIKINNNTITGILDTVNSQSEGGIAVEETLTGTDSICSNQITGVASTGVTASIAGINVDYCNWPAGGSISGNTISNISASKANACGIYFSPIGDVISGGTVDGNNIYDISSTSSANNVYDNSGATGIFLSCSSSVSTGLTVSNNFIANVTAYGYATAGTGNMLLNGTGIAVYSGVGYNIYFNSVNLAANQVVAGRSAAIYIEGNQSPLPSSLNVEDNLFVNTETTGSTYGIYSEVAKTAFTTIDYNDYYAATGLGYIGTSSSPTVTAMQANFGGNTHSGDILPNFVSPTNLHLTDYNNFCLASGTPIVGITTDIDGNTRLAPDMGADEFTYYFESTTAAVTCLDPNAVVTVTDTSGTLATGTYNITYNLSAPNLSTGDTATILYVAGSTDSGTFSIPSSLLANVGSTTVTITSIIPTATCSVYLAPVPVAVAASPSNQATFTVGGGTIIPSIIISASDTAVCLLTPVTFTAVPTGGGITPSYQWKKNGSNAGVNDSVYVDSTPVNDEVITCVMTSSSPCASPDSAISNSVTITVNATLVPAVSVIASQTTICVGAEVTFTATPVNGGSSPVYQWEKNGNEVGSDTAVYSDSTFSSGDSVWVVMTSNSSCANPSTAASNKIIITVNPEVTPSIIINAGEDTICEGTSVTFTATPSNGGTTPGYQWKINGNNVGNGSSDYTTTALTNEATVSCVLTSSAQCASPITANSNDLTVTVNPVASPTISISGNDSICSSGPAVPTAVIANGGSTPSYQWKKNGTDAGVNDSVYVDSTPVNNEVVTCVLTSSAACASPNSAISNSITITLSATRVPSVSVIASQTTICAGTQVTFTATPVNGGSAPAYQWEKNGTDVGTDAAVYSDSTLSTGDSVWVVMTSNSSCANPSTAASNKTIITVNPSVIPSIIINASADTICAGTGVTFTATPSNGGATPGYQWKVHGNNVGNDNSDYTTTALTNGAIVSCVLTSSEQCANPITVNSNADTIVVNTSVTPTISIGGNDTICPGNILVLFATIANGGSSPSYQWQVNGFDTAGNSNSFSSSKLTNGDIITCILTSNASCASRNIDTSNAISVNVLSSVVPTDSINMRPMTVCAGQAVTFEAIVSGQGAEPIYQWKVNGINAGPDSAFFTTSNLVNTDTVAMVLTSSLNCANPQSVNSNTLYITVNPLPVVTLSVYPDTVCSSHASLMLADNPGGGVYSGTAVYNGIFYPDSAIIGANYVTYLYTDSDNCSNSATYPILVENCTGIDEPALDNMRVFPNPTADIINIYTNSNEMIFVSLTDVSGKMMIKNMPLSGLSKTIDLSAFADGVYFLMLKNKMGDMQVVKLVKR